MEVLSLYFIALATVLGLWLLKLTASSVDKSKPRKRLPPGPWTLPFIGNLHVISLLLHRTMMELSRRYGKLMFLRLGEVPTVVVSNAKVAALVMKTKDLTFATRPRIVTQEIVGCGGRGLTFGPYGDHWRQMRKVCIVELLSTKQVKRMDSIREAEVAHLVRSVAASAAPGDIVNLSEKVESLGNDVIARAVFSRKCAQQGEYLHELDEIIALLGGFSLVDLFPSSRLVRSLTTAERNVRRSYGRIQRIIAEIIEERKAKRAADGASSTDNEDLLDVLLRLQEEDSLMFPLTSETIGAVIFDILGGASETTATTLEWAMSELMKNPEAMAKAQLEVRKVLGQERAVVTYADLGELHYMRMVIKEVFRLHPPAPLLVPRVCREDCEILGYDIPKGTNIIVNAFAISRDPRYWDNPEEFKPERFQNNNVDYKGQHFQFIPFGAGRRQCPGMLFGSSTVEIALANLLYHFDWVLPDGGSPESLDMSEKFGITVTRRSDLQLRAIPLVPYKAT